MGNLFNLWEICSICGNFYRSLGFWVIDRKSYRFIRKKNLRKKKTPTKSHNNHIQTTYHEMSLEYSLGITRTTSFFYVTDYQFNFLEFQMRMHSYTCGFKEIINIA